MSNVKALKKPSSAGKGDLPERGQASHVIKSDTRPGDNGTKKKPLQFMVSPAVFDEFSEKAAAMFGHKKGAKTLYFEYLLNKS